MSVTPWMRLSEDVIGQAIMEFYRRCKLVPVGIAEQAMMSWKEKMSYAARKLVQKFRRMFAETPTNAKGSQLKALKARCLEYGITPPERSPRRQSSEGDVVEPLQNEPLQPATHEALEELAPVPKANLDFQAFGDLYRQRLAARAEADKLKVPMCESGKQLEGQAQRPVATPARTTKHELPSFVVEAVSKEMPVVKPFATTGVEDDLKEEGEMENEVETCGKAKKKTKGGTAPKAKSKPKQKAKAKGKKGVKEELAGPEVEEALRPKPSLQMAPTEASKTTYVAGQFSQIRLAFIAECKASGMSHADANSKWMLSNKRAELLMSLPEKDLKRRRFAA